MSGSTSSPANIFSTWTGATFRPNEFFSRPAKNRSSIGPIAFTALLSVVAALPEALLGQAGSTQKVTPAGGLGMVVGTLVFSILGVYATAGILHFVLRIAGVGNVSTKNTRQVKPSDSSDTESSPYEPPTAELPLDKPSLGPWSETLAAVAYARAPLLIGVFGPIGAIVGITWWLVVLGIALARVHRMSLWRGYATSFGVIIGPVIFALGFRAGFVEAFKIPAGSMMPTLMIGDHIFVNKFTYGPKFPLTDSRVFTRLPPKVGDVIVFKFPENPQQDFIKRVVGLPGDTIEVINGRPIINGKLVPHCKVGQFGPSNSDLFVEFLGDAAFFTLFDSGFIDTDEPSDSTCKTNDDCALGKSCRAGMCGHVQGPFKVAPGEVFVMGDNRHNSHDSRSWRGGIGGGVPFDNIKGRAGYVWMSFGPTGDIATGRIGINIMGQADLPRTVTSPLREAVEKCLKERK